MVQVRIRRASSETPRVRRGLTSARAFLRDRRGNIVVMGAVAALPLTLLAGGASDFARSWQVRNQLQSALDAAALAGAKAENSPTVAAAAFQPQVHASVSVDPPVFTPQADGSFTAVVNARSPNAFLAAAAISVFPVQARSTVKVRFPPNDVCLVARDPTGAGFASAGGSQTLASNCRFEVKSTGSPAASFAGSGSVQTKQLCVKGATVSQSNASVTGLQLACTMTSPYRAEPATPSVPATCTATNPPAMVGATIGPGTYCGNIIIEGGAVTTLLPGLYIIKGATSTTPGHLLVRGSGAVRGDNVTFYFADATTMTLEGSGELRLTAPTTGAYQGVLFNEAPNLPQSTIRMTRSGAGLLRGVMNLPSRNLFVASSGNTTTDELTMVLNRATIEGSGAWSFRSAPPSVADRLTRQPYLSE